MVLGMSSPLPGAPNATKCCRGSTAHRQHIHSSLGAVLKLGQGAFLGRLLILCQHNTPKDSATQGNLSVSLWATIWAEGLLWSVLALSRQLASAAILA